MDKILQKGCKWKISGNIDLFNNLNDTYDSEQALDLALLALSENTFERGVIFQSVSPQQAVRQILEDINNHVGAISEEKVILGEDPDDVETYLYVPKSIGVTRFLTSFVRPDNSGKPYITPFDQKVWAEKEFEKLKDKGYTEEKAREIVENKIKTWPYLTALGTAIHSVFEAIFKEEIPNYEEILNSAEKKLLKKGTLQSIFSRKIFDSLVKQINDLKKNLKEEYPEADFYSEQVVISKELSNEILSQMGDDYDSILGKIDLLVVEKNGNAHLYDFKVSRKGLNLDSWNIENNELIPENEWKSAKKNGVKYQLAFYAALLKQYGIKVIDTNIIPVRLDLSYEDNDNQTNITNVQEAKLTPQKRNVEGTLTGRQADMARSTIKRNTQTTAEELTNVSNIYSIFFPENSTLNKIRTNKAKTDYYKNNPRFVKQLSPGDSGADQGKYRFTRLNLDNKFVYCKTEEDLEKAITAYIQDLGDKETDFHENLANRIEQVITGKLAFEDLMNDLYKSRREWGKNQFKRYFTDGWEFNNDPVMISMGLFMFTKNGKAEIISIDNSTPLDVKYNLGKGDTLLGKTKRNKFVDNSKILSATNGNLNLMKIMIYVANNKDKFDGLTITEARVLNLSLEQEANVLNSKLLYNYDALCRANPDAKSAQVTSKLFADDIKALVENANSRLRTVDTNFEGFTSPEEGESLMHWLTNAIEGLKEHYDQLYKAPDWNDPVWQAYRYLYEALMACKGYSTAEETYSDMYISKGLKLNGLMLSSPQYSPSINMREFGTILQSYESEVAKRVYQRAHKFRTLVEKVYKENGNGTQAFENWFVHDANGIDQTLTLKDPDSPEFNGSEANKECLREFLKVINDLRYPGYTESQINALKTDGRYYEVPLMEALGTRQLKERIAEKGLLAGIGKVLSDKWKQYWNLTQNVFAEDEIEYTRRRQEENQNKVFGQLYNKFQLVGNQRAQKIAEHEGIAFFEKNLEIVFNAALVEFTKVEVSEEYIPILQAIRLNLLHDQDSGHVQNQKVLETFEKAVKSKVYGEPIIEDKTLIALTRWLNVVRKVFTTMSLSLNVTSFLRESLQGIYTGMSRSLVKQLPGINEKNYVEALSYVIKESPKNFSSVSFLQQLNAVYQMANQSVTQIANQRRVNWLNVKNWQRDTLFITATAPDFMHRVSILVAKMMGDGCWEAHSLEDGKLKYDFKKDKRFQHFINNETDHKDYLKEKSLYLTMMEEFIKQGYTKDDGTLLKIGDDLPQAYTNKEAQTIKNYADLLYGHYDDSSRSLLVDTFLGSFIMQYKTYITAKFEQWTMPEGIYNTDTLKQQFDPVTGESLYAIITEDDEGFHRDIIRESELTEEQKAVAQLYYDYEGIPMQGLFQESIQFMKDLLSFDSETWKHLMDDPTRRGYLYLALHDQFIMALLMFLVTFLFGEATDVKHPLSPMEVGRKVRDMGPISQIAYNVVQGSTLDAQFLGLASQGGILGNLFTNPPLLTSVQRFARTNWQMITGKSSLPYVAAQNVGAIRSFQGVLKQFNPETE